MNLQRSQTRIGELLSIFVTQIKTYGALRHSDINVISEDVLIPLFREVYGYLHIENLNRTKSANYPGIDLADGEAKVAFQVSSTPTSEKVKDTLEKIVGHQHYRKYDRFIVYVLSEKQKSYPTMAFKKVVGDLFEFDPKKDILDYRDLIRDISGLSPERIWRIEQILEEHFGLPGQPFWSDRSDLPPESLFLNLLEVTIPERLFIGKSMANRKEIIANSRGRTLELNHKCGSRDVVRAALEQMGLKFGVDWEVYGGTIITFHDVTDDTCPLSKIIDVGTVDCLKPVQFYDKSEDHERVFKSLLRRCLQQKLYHLGVKWQQDGKLYIFTGKEGEVERDEQWQAQKKATRKVFEITPQRDEPKKTWYCKHLAFQSQVYRFASAWYLLIKPEWFFSSDGYSEYKYSKDKVSWLKRREWNAHVFNHLKFLTYFLKTDKEPGLFETNKVYPYLKFERLKFFSNALGLDDAEWLNREEKADREKLETEEGLVPLPF
jgi:hypothetical protein